MTYLILIRSKVPTSKEISRIEKMLASADVSEDQFVAGNYWFEESETSKDRHNALVFERVKMIKQLLWQTH